MKGIRSVAVDVGSQGTPAPVGQRASDPLRQLGGWLAADWRGRRFVSFGIAAAVVTACVAALYYANNGIEPDPDSSAYLLVAHRLATLSSLPDPQRVPGYPLLIAAVFAVFGRDNLAAASVAQAALFICAIVELYALLCVLLRRAWAALAVALLAGTSVNLLSYVRPILSEALALWLVTTLACAVVLYLRRPRRATLWAAAAVLLALCLTRPEWIYLPIPLFAFLLWAARGRVPPWAQLMHAVASLAVLYAALGGYMWANHARNGCGVDMTYVQNFNLLGKIMQYRMQDEAPPQYAALARVVDQSLASGNASPWQLVGSGAYSPLKRDCQAVAGAYSLSIIATHPLEYAAKSIPVAAQTLTDTTDFRPIVVTGTFAGALSALDAIGSLVIRGLILFPLVAVHWVVVALRRSADWRPRAAAALALIGAYGVALTALGSYAYYPRLRAPYAPLLIALVWGTLLVAGIAICQWVRAAIGGGSEQRKVV